jgi:hypothetical protein
MFQSVDLPVGLQWQQERVAPLCLEIQNLPKDPDRGWKSDWAMSEPIQQQFVFGVTTPRANRYSLFMPV